MIKIKKIQIKNFKSFQDVTVNLDPDFNVFTGVNNAGKTNLLEAIALWHECFNKLIRQAGKTYKDLYSKGDWILGHTTDKYFPYETIKTVRSSSVEDIFYRCDKTQSIELIITLEKTLEENNSLNIEIGFSIKTSGQSYVIELINYNQYKFHKFNSFFNNFPEPISASFASPVAAIRAEERFLTRPQIVESIQKRESVDVIRNRLYSLHYNNSDLLLYEDFKRDLSYILLNSSNAEISFFPKSDLRKDVKVIIDYKANPSDVEKDISLLGSGTLQIIVILLNLYAPEQNRDLNLILFDEPDSHIHRDIQQRLIDTLLRFSETTQIFMTTHNESLIRQVSLHQLFHLENRPRHEYNALSQQETLTTLNPHFKGIYPSALNPIMSSLGNSNGLDFVNAIEADRVILVEGKDDACVIYKLLQKRPINTKKYSFWVIGGIDNIFNPTRNIASYKSVFDLIKNDVTLWEKSVLIMDRDYVSDIDDLIPNKDTNHFRKIINHLDSKLNLRTYSCSSYTFESVLLTDLNILSSLLRKWLLKQEPPITLGINDVQQRIEEIYFSDNFKDYFRQKYTQEPLNSSSWINQTCGRYRNLRTRIQYIFNTDIINVDDNDLKTMYHQYLLRCIDSNDLYRIAQKDDVEYFLNLFFESFSIEFNIENDFLDLIDCSDRNSIWFSDWNFINSL